MGITNYDTMDATQYTLDGVALGAQREWDGVAEAWVASHALAQVVTKITIAGANQLVFLTDNGTSSGNALFGTASVPSFLLSVMPDDAVSNVSTAVACWATAASFNAASTSYLTVNCSLITNESNPLNVSASVSIMAWGTPA